MAVPYTFGTATAAIPLSQLDTNFATAITIGNTAVQLGNTVTTLNNMTLANVTISSGNVTLTNVSVTTANVSTANIVNSIVTTGQTLSYGTANGVAYLNSNKVLTTGSALVFDGTNLGLGVTPVSSYTGYKTFQIASQGVLSSDATSNGELEVNNNAYRAPSTATLTYINTAAATKYAQYRGEHRWFNAPSGTAGNAITFTQVMTLDNDNLLVGTTDSLATSGAGFKVLSGRPVVVNSASVNTTTVYEVYSTGASAYRFYVGLGGTVYATSTTITAISDQRLKENIRDLDDGLSAVMALKPRKFDWKEGKGANIKDARGFIAQEFEQVFPDMIEEWRDPAPEGEEPYKAINANLIPTLVKAMQEQQSLITSLTERISALEAK